MNDLKSFTPELFCDELGYKYGIFPQFISDDMYYYSCIYLSKSYGNSINQYAIYNFAVKVLEQHDTSLVVGGIPRIVHSDAEYMWFKDPLSNYKITDHFGDFSCSILYIDKKIETNLLNTYIIISTKMR